MIDAKTNPPTRAIYQALFHRWGPQKWWPARSRFEIMIGAILTQNTAWTHVEKAIDNLRAHRLLIPRNLHAASRSELADIIRPAGSYNVKAKRIKNFTDWLFARHGGNIDSVFRHSSQDVRKELLSINGIGKETADCMLLYAGNKPVFVVDAYTRRILNRHGWAQKNMSYEDVAALFEKPWRKNLPKSRAHVFNEFHALIVKLAKEHCRTRPDCGQCPLKKWPTVDNDD